MRFHILKTLSVLFIFSTGAVGLAEKTPTPDELIKGAAQALHFKNGKSVALMTISKAGKSDETRKLNMWFASQKDGYKLVIKISEPAKLSGTGFLTIKEGSETASQWLYIPAYKKSRKIRRGNENESFVGSDFTFADLNFENQSAYDFKIDGETNCGKEKCYVLVGTAKSSGDNIGYSKKVFYMRKSDSLNMKTDYFDPSGKLVKTMNLTEGTGDMKVKSLELKDLSNGNKTVMEFLAHAVDDKIPDTTFSLSFLEK
jgi:hypothetical protein